MEDSQKVKEVIVQINLEIHKLKRQIENIEKNAMKIRQDYNNLMNPANVDINRIYASVNTLLINTDINKIDYEKARAEAVKAADIRSTIEMGKNKPEVERLGGHYKELVSPVELINKKIDKLSKLRKNLAEGKIKTSEVDINRVR